MLFRKTKVGWKVAGLQWKPLVHWMHCWCLLLPAMAWGTMQVLQTDDSELKWENMDHYRKLILPDPSELEWKKIQWESQLAVAVQRASQEERPILIWAMNGHPLGCT